MKLLKAGIQKQKFGVAYDLEILLIWEWLLSENSCCSAMSCHNSTFPFLNQTHLTHKPQGSVIDGSENCGRQDLSSSDFPKNHRKKHMLPALHIAFVCLVYIAHTFLFSTSFP